MKLIDVGFGNTVNSDRVIAFVNADAAPTKRIIAVAKENSTAIDTTCGRKTKSVLIMDSGHIVLSSKDVESITKKFSEDE